MNSIKQNRLMPTLAKNFRCLIRKPRPTRKNAIYGSEVSSDGAIGRHWLAGTAQLLVALLTGLNWSDLEKRSVTRYEEIHPKGGYTN